MMKAVKTAFAAAILLTVFTGASAADTPVAAAASAVADTAQPAEARIRLFGRNGKPTTMKYEENGKTKSVNVGGSLGSAFASFVGAARNKSLGIPETDITRVVLADGQLLSKVTYTEFAVPAGRPVRVRSAVIPLANVSNAPGVHMVSYTAGCNGKEVTFTPQPGTDYEIAPISSGSRCGVTVYQVKTTDGVAVAYPLSTENP